MDLKKNNVFGGCRYQINGGITFKIYFLYLFILKIFYWRVSGPSTLMPVLTYIYIIN